MTAMKETNRSKVKKKDKERTKIEERETTRTGTPKQCGKTPKHETRPQRPKSVKFAKLVNVQNVPKVPNVKVFNISGWRASVVACCRAAKATCTVVAEEETPATKIEILTFALL